MVLQHGPLLHFTMKLLAVLVVLVFLPTHILAETESFFDNLWIRSHVYKVYTPTNPRLWKEKTFNVWVAPKEDKIFSIIMTFAKEIKYNVFVYKKNINVVVNDTTYYTQTYENHFVEEKGEWASYKLVMKNNFTLIQMEQNVQIVNIPLPEAALTDFELHFLISAKSHIKNSILPEDKYLIYTFCILGILALGLAICILMLFFLNKYWKYKEYKEIALKKDMECAVKQEIVCKKENVSTIDLCDMFENKLLVKQAVVQIECEGQDDGGQEDFRDQDDGEREDIRDQDDGGQEDIRDQDDGGQEDSGDQELKQ